jgi:catechol 2,3-dioxygenase-like lactoylglutathione lyase family enzyme
MAPVVSVTGLDHIVLTTSDIEQALEFYCDTLGLPGVRLDEWRRGEIGFPSVRVDQATIIDLFPGTPDGKNLEHFCFVVEAIDLAELAQSGKVEVVSGPTERLFGAQGFATSLYIAAPDANTVELRCYD